MKNATKKGNKNGFTLIEILIVVIIIGLLAAIGIPSFRKAKDRALSVTKSGNARQTLTLVEYYGELNNLNGTALVTTANLDSLTKGLDWNAAMTVGATQPVAISKTLLAWDATSMADLKAIMYPTLP